VPRAARIPAPENTNPASLSGKKYNPARQLEHRLGRARLAIPDHIGHIYLFVIM
jgi:hypothetical protein